MIALSPLTQRIIEQSAYKLQAEARKLKHDATVHQSEKIGQVLKRQSWLIQSRAQALLELLGEF